MGPAMIMRLLEECAYFLDVGLRYVMGFMFPEKPGPNDYVWSKYDPLFQPIVRLENGKLSGDGTLWRRRRKDGRWEYRQDPETLEEWSCRQW